jgi:hypothetical protein
MDITGSSLGVASLATGLQVRDGVGIYALRKALDAQAAGALSLIQALPSPQQASSSRGLPEHIGRNIDVTA